jgi:hypothetical protein
LNNDLQTFLEANEDANPVNSYPPKILLHLILQAAELKVQHVNFGYQPYCPFQKITASLCGGTI